jgi:hypothetical protein
MNKEKQAMNGGNDSVLLTFFFTNFARRDHAAVLKLEDEPERACIHASMDVGRIRGTAGGLPEITTMI